MKINYILPFSFLVVILAGCSFVESTLHYFEISEAKKAVLENLVDPDSAKFKDVSYISDHQLGWCVVGLVNSKNRMGGYTGYQPFAYIKNGQLKIGERVDEFIRFAKFRIEESKNKNKNENNQKAGPTDARVEKMQTLIADKKYDEAIKYGKSFSWSSGNAIIKQLQAEAEKMKNQPKEQTVQPKLNLIPVRPADISTMKRLIEKKEYKDAVAFSKKYEWNSEMKQLESQAKKQLGIKWYE